MKLWMVLLVSLMLALGVGCTNMTGPQRALGGGLCKAQCPIVKSLALRACAQMDPEAEPVLYEACLSEADAIYMACPGTCDAIFAEPELVPESEPIA